jgi:hypothetical protein
MATTFKELNSGDITSTTSLIHEAIPITGSIVSGTYVDSVSDATNVKNYAHGMFQSVYDYPYLSSSANHIFDLTAGYSAQSSLSGTSNTQQPKKINIYNEMAQVLMGFDYTGSVQLFDEDGDLSAGGTKLQECLFINFARLLTKDELKKGSFSLELGVNPTYGIANTTSRVILKDTNAADNFRVNSPAGEYAVLYATNALGTQLKNPLGGATDIKAGLLYYQAGIAVVTASIFKSLLSSSVQCKLGVYETIDAVLTGSVISSSCDDLRHRIYNLSFNNTTELNSTIYFCRANHRDFNYSSNPTYLSSSKIFVKTNSFEPPISYITTVGLYSIDGELLATAKLSEPIKKDPTKEVTLRVRLDY